MFLRLCFGDNSRSLDNSCLPNCTRHPSNKAEVSVQFAKNNELVRDLRPSKSEDTYNNGRGTQATEQTVTRRAARQPKARGRIVQPGRRDRDVAATSVELYRQKELVLRGTTCLLFPRCGASSALFIFFTLYSLLRSE